MHIKEFISEISNIKSVHPWIAYSDFMEVSVCTLKKPFEYIYDENIDNKFLSVLKKYNDKEKEKNSYKHFAKSLGKILKENLQVAQQLI